MRQNPQPFVRGVRPMPQITGAYEPELVTAWGPTKPPSSWYLFATPARYEKEGKGKVSPVCHVICLSIRPRRKSEEFRERCSTWLFLSFLVVIYYLGCVVFLDLLHRTKGENQIKHFLAD